MMTTMRVLLLVGQASAFWSALALPLPHARRQQLLLRMRLSKQITTTTTMTTSTALFYQNNSTETEFAAHHHHHNHLATSTLSHVFNNAEDEDDDVINEEATTTTTMRSLREVDRLNLHPVYKLGVPTAIPLSILAAVAVMTAPVTGPLLPFFVLYRKHRYQKLLDMVQQEHQATFDATTAAYRLYQRQLVDTLLKAKERRQAMSSRSSHTSTTLPSVVAVTMATGQEGQGVVRSLVQEARSTYHHDGAPPALTILACVRNPTSKAAMALQRMSGPAAVVRLVTCDSTDAASLREALYPAQAVYLATTLNQAAAGTWQMQWNAGDYEIEQGRAFCEAYGSNGGLPNLRHLVYGTAPMKKWPNSFADKAGCIEPPIHYAAKWRIEQLLTEAGIPCTFLRKCPYHENFTKLTQATRKQAVMGVEGGGAFDDALQNRNVQLEPGTYQIKALTPPGFAYNMMDPRDTGKWAVLAFAYPQILIGHSLSVASDCLTGYEMAEQATASGALGEGVIFEYAEQPRWLFESLAWMVPTFVYISGLQRWNSDGGQYDLDKRGVEHVRQLVAGCTWSGHLEREGLGQFTETMAELLPDVVKRF